MILKTLGSYPQSTEFQWSRDLSITEGRRVQFVVEQGFRERFASGLVPGDSTLPAGLEWQSTDSSHIDSKYSASGAQGLLITSPLAANSSIKEQRRHATLT